MSAKDSGAPGGGAKMVAVETSVTPAGQRRGGHAGGGDPDNQSGLLGSHVVFDPQAQANPVARAVTSLS